MRILRFRRTAKHTDRFVHIFDSAQFTLLKYSVGLFLWFSIFGVNNLIPFHPRPKAMYHHFFFNMNNETDYKALIE